ncbi:hypothetical protein V8E36_006965 [Tilletia maclaganii]
MSTKPETALAAASFDALAFAKTTPTEVSGDTCADIFDGSSGPLAPFAASQIAGATPFLFIDSSSRVLSGDLPNFFEPASPTVVIVAVFIEHGRMALRREFPSFAGRSVTAAKNTECFINIIREGRRWDKCPPLRIGGMDTTRGTVTSIRTNHHQRLKAGVRLFRGAHNAADKFDTLRQKWKDKLYHAHGAIVLWKEAAAERRTQVEAMKALKVRRRAETAAQGAEDIRRKMDQYQKPLQQQQL